MLAFGEGIGMKGTWLACGGMIDEGKPAKVDDAMTP